MTASPGGSATPFSPGGSATPFSSGAAAMTAFVA